MTAVDAVIVVGPHGPIVVQLRLAALPRPAPPLNGFRVRCLRHARHHATAYDARIHRYDPEYVVPSSWRLELDASAAVRVVITPEPPPDLPRAEPEDHPEVRVPASVSAYHWRLEREQGGTFVDVTSGSSGRRPRIEFDAPTGGAREARFRASLRVALTDGGDLRSSATFLVRDLLIVSLGDSSASGEGNPDAWGEPALVSVPPFCRLRTDPVWQEAGAHRSYVSGPSFAAAILQERTAATTRGADDQVVIAPTFLTFASSGAKIADLTNTRQRGFQPGPQVREARLAIDGRRPVDVVLVAAGINDIGFADQIKALVFEDVNPGLALLLHAGGALGLALAYALLEGDSARRQFQEAAAQVVAQIPDRYLALATVIDEELAPGAVVVTGYPDRPFEQDDGSSASCGMLDMFELDISTRDIDAINQAGAELNQAIAHAVAEIDRQAGRTTRWHFVDVAPMFRRHGYCAASSYYIHAGQSCARQGDIKGTLHPNRLGLEHYGELIYHAMVEHVLPRGAQPDRPLIDLDVSHRQLGFGRVPVGELSVQTLTVTNAGDTPVTIDIPPHRGRLSWSAVQTTLRPGGGVTIPVRFLPVDRSDQTATMSIDSAPPASPHRVAITGRGDDGNEPGEDDGPIHPH